MSLTWITDSVSSTSPPLRILVLGFMNEGISYEVNGQTVKQST